jgi:hypothetical protein
LQRNVDARGDIDRVAHFIIRQARPRSFCRNLETARLIGRNTGKRRFEWRRAD